MEAAAVVVAAARPLPSIGCGGAAVINVMMIVRMSFAGDSVAEVEVVVVGCDDDDCCWTSTGEVVDVLLMTTLCSLLSEFTL